MKAKSSKGSTPTMKKNSSTKEEVKAASHVDSKLVGKAVSALIKYHNEKVAKKEEEGTSLSLLGNDRAIMVQFGLEVAPGQTSRKPIRIDIPNPILQTANTAKNDDDEGLEEVDVCLIVKDESKPWIQEMVEEYSEHMGCVKKVLTLDSLRKKYSRFQQRRELLEKYDVFMADDRILPMLTSALGKEFVKSKKLPLPLSITRKAALPFAIQRNLSATYMTISPGTSIMIRAGNTGMPEKKLMENVVAIAQSAASRIPRKWANIRNIAIKTPESVSLPFYHKLPEELLEIANMAGIAPAFKPLSADKTDTDIAEDKDVNDSPKRKRDLAAKSPLVRALKKQKQEAKEDGEAKKEKLKKGKTGEKKGQSDPKTPESATIDGKRKSKKSKDSYVGEKTNNETPKSSKSDKKKRKEPGNEGDADFVPSKKYKGSKKGYVFRSGKDGVGYYVDVKPVVDKMVLQALARAASQGGSRSRSKSGGKRRGRR